MNPPDNPRYTVEGSGEFFFVRDNLTGERLPYESKNKSFVEGVASRLEEDYENYLKEAPDRRPKA